MSTFKRGLTERFMEDLETGIFSGIRQVSLAMGLDIRIRDSYINIYRNGCSVLKLKEIPMKQEYSADIHCKYLQGLQVDNLPHSLRNGYNSFPASKAFVDFFLQHIGKIAANTSGHPIEEATIEEKILATNNLDLSSAIFVDRQICYPGKRGELDLIALTQCEPNGFEFILGELKQGLNSGIKALDRQIKGYYELLTDSSGQLKEDVRKSYEAIVDQSSRLGILPKSIGIPSQSHRVVGLLILYNYNPKSELLNMLQDSLKTGANGINFPLYLITLDTGNYKIPPRRDWKELHP